MNSSHQEEYMKHIHLEPGYHSKFIQFQVIIPARSLKKQIFAIAQDSGHAISDGWDTYSSRRWKTNIHTLDSALAKVQQLRGVSYDLKTSGQTRGRSNCSGDCGSRARDRQLEPR